MPFLASSLALSTVGALLFLAAPPGLGPLGPFFAGILAWAGYRRVRRHRGTARHATLARAAMSLALLLMAHQAWVLVRGVEVRVAQSEVRRVIADIDTALRTGTAEGTFLLLDDDARAAADGEAWTRELRAAQAILGSLEELGPPELAGGDIGADTARFREEENAEARFSVNYREARFQRGRARVEIDILVRKREGRISGTATRLRVTPGGATGR